MSSLPVGLAYKSKSRAARLSNLTCEW